MRLDQLSGEKELMVKNNAYFAHLRDAKSRERAPRYEQSFGFKLKQRMDIWASNPAFDASENKLYTWARDFFYTRANLPYINDHEQRKRAKQHV